LVAFPRKDFLFAISFFATKWLVSRLMTMNNVQDSNGICLQTPNLTKRQVGPVPKECVAHNMLGRTYDKTTFPLW
jgi:hypothetical protein